MESPKHSDSIQAGATGLLANGSAGAWDIEVVESINGPERWFLLLDNGGVYLYCELKSLDTVKEISTYLERKPKRAREAGVEDPGLLIGSFGGHCVKIIHDDEFDDRLFLSVRGENDSSVMRIEISGDSLSNFGQAIGQVESDLFQ